MKYALINSSNIITNVIDYDGSSPYTPQDGMTVHLINDWLNIGDNISAAQPTPSVPVPPPAPTKAQLQAQLDIIAAQIAAL